MKQTIYLDVLLSVNLLVDYFLLYAAAQLSGRSISRARLCLGAVAGACGSCIILLPALPTAVHMMITAALSVVMVLIAFGYGSPARLAKSAGLLALITVCYGGLMMAVWLFVAPSGLVINNGAVYIDIPPAMLILMTVICYAAVTLISRRARKRNLIRSRCSVRITTSLGSVTVDGIIDTGNLLCEPFSGLPVIIAELGAVRDILPRDTVRVIEQDLVGIDTPLAGLRVIPYSNISGKGMLPAYKPEEITIELSGERRERVEAYIAILREGAVGRGYRAIVNPDAII